MNVIVIGGGIIGVTTAYFLRQKGFEVAVIERRSDVAQEASFGNAGIIAPGYVTPWAAPGMPTKVLSYLFKSEAPVLFRPNLNPALWRWLRRWLRECSLERYRVNKERMQRVALYSRTCLHALREEYAIDYQQSQGYLQLFRSQADLDLSEPGRQMLREQGILHEALDAAGCYRLEPELARHTPLAGGLHLPADESGNCPLFAKRLKVICEQQGVKFHFGETVKALQVESKKLVGVKLNTSTQKADACVIAAGHESAALLGSVGIRVPIYPVKGYSVTMRLKSDGFGPNRALMDEAYKTAITPMGNTLRVAGTAELGNHKLDLREAARRTLERVVSDWFPGVADFQSARYWAGARPMLPDGPPLVGPSPIEGLFLNCGHGSTGWAMSCGTAKLTADILAGRATEISIDGLTLKRYA